MKMEEWVAATGARVVVVFEGRDAAGKGGVIKRITEHTNPRTTRVVALPKPTERAADPVVLPAIHRGAPRGGRDRPVRSQLVQPRRRGARPRLLHAAGVPALPPPVPDLRAAADRGRHHPDQVLVLGERRGTGATVREAHRRPDAAVEALSDRPVLTDEVDRVLARQGRDVRAHRHPGVRPGTWSRPTSSGARALNCIAHLLSKIPYVPKELPEIEIPDRQEDEGYVRPPRDLYTYVPDHASTLEERGRLRLTRSSVRWPRDQIVDGSRPSRHHSFDVRYRSYDARDGGALREGWRDSWSWV